MFDEEDINYLASHLPHEQLLREIRNADVREGVARMWAENHDVYYWQKFGKACKAALDVQKSWEPTRAVKPGLISVKATKENNDIVDVVDRYTELKKVGKEYSGRCPFHDDKHPSLRVSQDKQVFYCFSCGRKGDVIDFLGEIEGLNVKEACLLLAGT